ncbi:hypothetical protein CB0940_10246 [Cercospora beticola]|uniref:Uncharacterized protein n=1 Tax=Cercospora beticola TaxID=122368 RepID=A0A2G5HV64_CERBT|nr:hypothetical protein CB0940_10246 [Cercospora beticola]PIA96411.1 hypothetical protein CB0940_10246 [Cercospora beticola]WPB06954.1 hypothetical protein RHO25_011614 [Cercospora beticola]
MSSSMPIPKRKLPRSVIPSSSSPSGSLSSSSGSSSAYYSPPTNSSSWKGKSKVPISGSPATTSPQPESWLLSPRRPSLLGSSLSKSEYTVINLGHDEGLRLVSCVKSSQGWDWNQELFLPSYAANEYVDEDLEHRPDPVEEIVLTDEEAERMMPR